jgi:cardiolipin synthase
MQNLFLLSTILILLAQLFVVGRAILRPDREPASRLAWVIVIIVAPILGVVAYILVGEARIGSRRRDRARKIDLKLSRPNADDQAIQGLAGSFYNPPFELARTVNGLAPTGGNTAKLLPDSNASVDAMVADIDAARRNVHFCFYIWLADNNGLKLKNAMVRAAARGVEVRVLADALGSKTFVRSDHWQELSANGVNARVALPVGGILRTMIMGRVDLRNHRKVLVIDNAIAWCGSQNAADPEFRIKPRYAPWVDIMTRWEGPVARDWQFLFASDWMAEGGDDIQHLLLENIAAGSGDIVAQVIGTGPTLRFAAMSACFAELVHSAREELVITTPYFVPDEQLLFAIRSAARRGVKTRLVLPRCNDSGIVAATSRSHYQSLLHAGVEISEFEGGLLHAKTMVIDRRIGLIGSANLDRRSFDLNFESNIMFSSPDLAKSIRARQDEFLSSSRPVSSSEVDGFGLASRLKQNLLAMLGPLL